MPASKTGYGMLVQTDRAYRQWLSTGILLAILVCSFFLFRYQVIPGIPELSHSHLQMLFFPMVLLLLWRMRHAALGIPVQILLAVAVCGFISIWFVHTVFSSGYGAFHIARLTDDPYETQSRIFREGLNSHYSWNSSVYGYRYWEAIGSRSAAEAVLAAENEIRLLVWGNQKRIHLSFGATRTETLASMLDIEGSTALFDMEFITRVPVVGLPFEPQDAVQEYLSRLFSGMLPLAQNEVLISGAMGMRHELDLRAAAGTVSYWRTVEHRGFAWWILGNYYLRKALAESASRKGYLDCSARAFTVAASYVKRHDNPELFAAIHNNYALMHLIKRYLSGGKASLKIAQKSLLYALSASNYPGVYQATVDSFMPVKNNVRMFRKLKKQAYRNTEDAGALEMQNKFKKRKSKKKAKKNSGSKQKKRNRSSD